MVPRKQVILPCLRLRYLITKDENATHDAADSLLPDLTLQVASGLLITDQASAVVDTVRTCLSSHRSSTLPVNVVTSLCEFTSVLVNVSSISLRLKSIEHSYFLLKIKANFKKPLPVLAPNI